MEFFEFFRLSLIILITVSLYWPLTVPLAAAAYKVRIGAQEIPLSIVTFWVRSTVAALGMAVLSVALIGSDQALTWLGLPAGPVHLAGLPTGADWPPPAVPPPSGGSRRGR